MTTESELILAGLGIFREDETQKLFTICPHHRRELGLSWRRNTSKCCVPQILFQHGANRKADRGISKMVSEHIFKTTGIVEIGIFETEACLRSLGFCPFFTVPFLIWIKHFYPNTSVSFYLFKQIWLRVAFVLFVPLGSCTNYRKSVFKSSVSSVAGNTSTDMEEGAACATPLTDLESLISNSFSGSCF